LATAPKTKSTGEEGSPEQQMHQVVRNMGKVVRKAATAGSSTDTRNDPTNVVKGQKRKEQSVAMDAVEGLSDIDDVVAAISHCNRPVPLCVEMFAGSKRFTQAMLELDMDVVAFEIMDDPTEDILDSGTFDKLSTWLRSGTKFIHFGPPCKTFSIARWPKIRTDTHVQCLKMNPLCVHFE
jgi:hypothetical protein